MIINVGHPNSFSSFLLLGLYLGICCCGLTVDALEDADDEDKGGQNGKHLNFMNSSINFHEIIILKTLK